MGGQKKTRVRRTREEWDRILTRYAASGLSNAAFCHHEGLSTGSFARWKRRMSATQPAPAAFVELPPPVAPRSTALEAGELELVLPGDVRLRWKP